MKKNRKVLENDTKEELRISLRTKIIKEAVNKALKDFIEATLFKVKKKQAKGGKQ